MKASIIQYPWVADPRGGLGYLELGDHIPFEVRRMFYIVDIPPATRRGGHAHRRNEELVVVTRGAMTFTLDDGCETGEFVLEANRGALYIPRMTWLNYRTHSQATTCLVLASAPYSEADYIRDHDEFLARTSR